MERDQGSALVVVLALVIVVSSILISNGMVLHHLRAEMRLIEKQQQERLAAHAH